MKKLLEFGPLFIIVAALLWSLDGLLRISLYTLPPVVIVFYEHLFGALALLIISFKWVKDIKKFKKNDWVAMAVVSFFASVLATVLYTAALARINFIQYSVVVLLQQQLQPIWVFITAALLLKEKITKKFIGWALLALVAIYFVTFKDLHVNFATGGGTITAASFALLAGLMWGSATAVGKYILNKASFLTTTALRFILGTIFAFLLVVQQGQTAVLTHLTGSQILTLLAITFSTGMVALAIYYYGLKRTPARVSTICELVFPASAVVIDYFHFHNGLSLTQIAGVVVLVFAISKVIKFTK